MGKGKGKGKKGKKDSEPAEPAHDPGWEKAVTECKWERPPDALPDANMWPTWGALRERVLVSCKKVVVTWTPTVRDAFPAELVKLSPPELESLELRGCENLTKFTLSPPTSCPKLENIDLSTCNSLNFVLIQSHSLETLKLARCPSLTKALVHCKNLNKLTLEGCESLETLMVWSDQLMELDVSGSKSLVTCELYCPELYNPVLPTLCDPASAEPPAHPPIVQMLKDSYKEEARKQEEEREAERSLSSTNTVIPRTYRRG